MSPDLKLLVWSVALAFGQMLIAVLGACQQVGCRSWPATAMICPSSRTGPDARNVRT